MTEETEVEFWPLKNLVWLWKQDSKHCEERRKQTVLKHGEEQVGEDFLEAESWVLEEVSHRFVERR